MGKQKTSDGSDHQIEKITRSSGNVFRDLGLPNPADRLVKANLAHQICLLIKASGMSKASIAMQLGINKSKLISLMRGELKDVSAGRLSEYLAQLQ